jgi:hypothetical protein
MKYVKRVIVGAHAHTWDPITTTDAVPETDWEAAHMMFGIASGVLAGVGACHDCAYEILAILETCHAQWGRDEHGKFVSHKAN